MTTNPLWEGLLAIQQALTDAGLPVIPDPASFTTPGVLVEAPSVQTSTLGAWEMTVPVIVVGQAPATRDTLEWLLDKSAVAMTALGVENADPSVYTHSTQPFPAYRLTATVTVTRS